MKSTLDIAEKDGEKIAVINNIYSTLVTLASNTRQSTTLVQDSI